MANMCGRQGADATGCDDSCGRATVEMQMTSTFTYVGWDFVAETANRTEDISSICDGTDYPKLMWQFVIGDFAGDRDLDLADYSSIAARWLQTDSSFWCGGRADPSS